jgi:hypothetical protein
MALQVLNTANQQLDASYRIVPTTWVLYGLGVTQLGDRENTFQPTVGPATTVKAFMKDFFGYEFGFAWWCILIVFGYVLFFRLLGAAALRYLNFVKR